MKAFLLIAIGLGFCLSCKKSANIAPGLTGKWELRRAYGGFSYHDSSYKSGNGNSYKFNIDSTYQHFTNGVDDAHGVFHFKKNAYQESPANFYDELYFDNTTYGELIVIKGTKFTLGTTEADGIATEYEKISD